jgi:hypothetical protein
LALFFQQILKCYETDSFDFLFVDEVGIRIESVEIGLLRVAVRVILFDVRPKNSVGFARPCNSVSKDGTVVTLQNCADVFFEVLCKDGSVFVVNIVNCRKRVRSHFSVRVFVLLIGDCNSVTLFVDFEDFVDVAIVELCVERVNCWIHFYHFDGRTPHFLRV